MATVNLDTASRLDVVCRRGDTFKLVLEFGVKMPATGSDYSFSFAESDSVTADSASSSFTVDVTTGDTTTSQVSISCPAGTMGDISPGLYVYDFSVNDTAGIRFDQNSTTTLIFGTLKVVDDIGA